MYGLPQPIKIMEVISMATPTVPSLDPISQILIAMSAVDPQVWAVVALVGLCWAAIWNLPKS